MNRHISKACLYREFGWVEIDRESNRAYRICTRMVGSFLDSSIYKEKEGIFWPHVNKIDKMSGGFSSNIYKNYDVYEVEYIPHIIFWPEMSSAQIIESLVLLCDVLIYLVRNGWTAVTHIWNVVLHKGRPILIDVGDFKKYPHAKLTEYESFMSNIKRETTSIHGHVPISADDWMENLDEVCEHIRLTEKNNPIYFLQKSKDILTNVAKPRVLGNEWNSYHKNALDIESVLSEPTKGNKGSSLCKFIKQVSPKTMTDLGCNNGVYSFYAALQGCTCIGIDNCQSLIAKANQFSFKNNLSCSFATLNLLKDPVAWGLGGAYLSSRERFKSELVIAPAIIHHLFRQCSNIEKVINTILQYSEKYAAIEFIPHNDEHINLPVSKWFTYSQITNILNNNNFTEIAKEDSSPHGRKWGLWEKTRI